MSYLEPNEFVSKMVDAGESKVYMSTKDTLIRAFMAGAILGLAAIFAIEYFASIRWPKTAQNYKNPNSQGFEAYPPTPPVGAGPPF